MKRVFFSAFLGFLAFAARLPAAEVMVRITYDQGAMAMLTRPQVSGSAVVLPQGLLPFSRIKSMDADPGGELSLDACRKQAAEGRYDAMAKDLAPLLKPLDPFAGLPGNLNEYRMLLLKAQFWAGRFEEMEATAGVVEKGDAASVAVSRLYWVLALVEQGKNAPAEEAFAAAGKDAPVPEPMRLVVRARLAMAKREYREALQLLAQVVALHSRDVEWLPAAMFYEGLCYKRTGYLDAAAAVSMDLKDRYAGGLWARRAEELK